MRYSIQEMKNSGYTYYEIIDTEKNCDVVLRTKSYISALEWTTQLEAANEEYYAETKWSWEDVNTIRPEWSESKCRQWWKENGKWFHAVLTEHGNEMLANMLG